jgi:hypothetical protein
MNWSVLEISAGMRRQECFDVDRAIKDSSKELAKSMILAANHLKTSADMTISEE